MCVCVCVCVYLYLSGFTSTMVKCSSVFSGDLAGVRKLDTVLVLG